MPASLSPEHEPRKTTARPTRDAALVEELILLIKNFPNLHLVPLDLSLAHRSVDIAKAHHLRGSDSVYVVVAHRFDATLVTWDAEMLQRGRA